MGLLSLAKKSIVMSDEESRFLEMIEKLLEKYDGKCCSLTQSEFNSFQGEIEENCSNITKEELHALSENANGAFFANFLKNGKVCLDELVKFLLSATLYKGFRMHPMTKMDSKEAYNEFMEEHSKAGLVKNKSKREDRHMALTTKLLNMYGYHKNNGLGFEELKTMLDVMRKNKGQDPIPEKVIKKNFA